MLNGLDLFSGIGGLTIGLSEWVKPIAYCESDPYAQAVLMSRMWNRDIPRRPIWDDVRTLRGDSFEGTIDIIYGGFPCQDISAAGYGVGLGGERNGLFQHIIRLVQETNPRFIFLENVSAIRTRGLNGVAQAFTELGYDFRWTIVSAKEVGACHIRKRWFGLAHAHGTELRIESGRSGRQDWKAPRLNQFNGEPRTNTDADGEGLEGFRWGQPQIPRPAPYNGWNSKPTVRRRDNGVPNRSHRIRALGNSVVPTQAREAFMKLLYSKKESGK